MFHNCERTSHMRKNRSHSRSIITSPVSYSILRAMLTSTRSFYQAEIVHRVKASAPQVSRVLHWLLDRGYAERQPDGKYRVRNAVTIVGSAIPFQRSMSSSLIASFRLRGNKEEIKNLLVKEGAILCLESALEEYSRYYRSERICVYHTNPEKLLKIIEEIEGGIMQVNVYYPDIPLRNEVEKWRRTTKFRTVVDLACDGRIYTAKDLLKSLWGVSIE